MSESTEETTQAVAEDADLATDAEVTEAVEELVRSGKEESKAAARSSKAKAKPRATRAADKNVGALIDTVNTLAGSVERLAGTVHTLSDKVPGPVVDEPVAKIEDATAEAEAAVGGKQSVLTVAANYASVLAHFGGVGLVATGLFKQSTVSGLVLVVFGCFTFVVASAVQARESVEPGVKPMAKVAAGSLLTVLGLGMLIGGVQYFGTSPHSASKLIPLGVALSGVGVVIRSGYRVARENLLWMAGVGVWVCLILSVMLNSLAGDEGKTEAVVPAAADAHGATPAVATDTPTAGAGTTESAHGAEATPATEDHGTATAVEAQSLAPVAEHGAEVPTATSASHDEAQGGSTPTANATQAVESSAAEKIAQAKAAAVNAAQAPEVH